MPARAMAYGSAWVMSRPRTFTLPCFGRTRPSMDFISVVLPMPLLPIRPMHSPRATEKSTPCRMWLTP
jgi:hypothetical protein